MPTIKKRADELGLDDLRYDIEAFSVPSLVRESGRRTVGTLLLIEGPIKLRDPKNTDGVILHIAAGPRDTVKVYVAADSEVTVDRAPTRKMHHFGDTP